EKRRWWAPLLRLSDEAFGLERSLGGGTRTNGFEQRRNARELRKIEELTAPADNGKGVGVSLSVVTEEIRAVFREHGFKLADAAVDLADHTSLVFVGQVRLEQATKSLVHIGDDAECFLQAGTFDGAGGRLERSIVGRVAEILKNGGALGHNS